MLWWIISLVVMLSYCMLIGFYLFSLNLFEEEHIARQDGKDTFVSIIVVGRNEAHSIAACLQSIQNNSYPNELYEILFVDDHSEDRTREIVAELAIRNLKLLHLAEFIGDKKINSYKKAGIAYAIQEAQGSFILHTDADVVVGKDWILNHVGVYEAKKALFVAAPVFIIPDHSFLGNFQFLDFLITMGITAAGNQSGFHYLANGANMSYPGKLLNQVNLSRSATFASGDDMFLIHEASKVNPDGIEFIIDPDAAVHTYPEVDIWSFFSQRIRWAAKTKAYTDLRLQMVTVVVFLANALLLAVLIQSFFEHELFYLLLATFAVKSFVDVFFTRRVARFFKQQIHPWAIAPSLLFYPFYYLIVGVLSVFPMKFNWKDRKVR